VLWGIGRLHDAQHETEGRQNECDGCEQSGEDRLHLHKVRYAHGASLLSPDICAIVSRQSSHGP
jgi:hypothetical protein